MLDFSIVSANEDHERAEDPSEGTSTTSDSTQIFDLPREIRDLIYLHYPGYAWVDLMQMPVLALQPWTSFVSRQMRKESLEAFYSRKTYLIDLRGWKSDKYPGSWTPRTICNRWLEAIGDENAGCLRSLFFYSHNFTAHVKIENKQPGITLRFRARTGVKVDTVEGVTHNYTFELAAERARERIGKMFVKMSAERAGQDDQLLKAEDIKLMCEMFERVQPFLCCRNNILGSCGAVLLELSENDPETWPNTESHLNDCDHCGYHRITHGND
ncbi:hypothetical protein MBLNU230_g7553t1 [Neophaeotheca triangularis]